MFGRKDLYKYVPIYVYNMFFHWGIPFALF